MVLEGHVISNASRGVSLGVGFRVCRGAATGYAYTEDLRWPALMRCAATASHIAHARPGSVARLTERVSASRYLVDRPSFLASGALKRGLLERAASEAFRLDRRVQRVEASLVESHRELLIVTSEGDFVRDVGPMIRFGVRVVMDDGMLRQSGSSGGGGRRGLEYFEREQKSPEAHAREAVRVATAMWDARDLPRPGGEEVVVLAAGDSGILFQQALGHGLEGDYVAKGTSCYAGRGGTRVASSLCTMVDDGRLPGERGSINVDDEGNDGAETTLIEEGILRGYMHTRLSAKHHGVAPTGNGRRESFRTTPTARCTNFLMRSGPHTREEILRSVRRGVYARRYGGAQVDITSGDFIVSLSEAYLIEDGRVTAPLRNLNLVGNGPDMLQKVEMLASDFEMSDGIWTSNKDGQAAAVNVGCPTMKIAALTVGS